MGSQTLEILRQGVWASLTGGWFYDPHQNRFCNAVHLYLWIYLLCTPFVVYLYFPTAYTTWILYCVVTAGLITFLKIANYALHTMYDHAQSMSDNSLRKNVKVLKETTGDDDGGIEMQVIGATDLPSRGSGERHSEGVSHANSVLSFDFQEEASMIDLKVDVHRKNSSESSDSLAMHTKNNNALQSSTVQTHCAELCQMAGHRRSWKIKSKSEDTSHKRSPISEEESFEIAKAGGSGDADCSIEQYMQEECSSNTSTTAIPDWHGATATQPSVVPKSISTGGYAAVVSKEEKRRRFRNKLHRQISLDSDQIGLGMVYNPDSSDKYKLQRYRSSESNDDDHHIQLKNDERRRQYSQNPPHYHCLPPSGFYLEHNYTQSELTIKPIPQESAANGGKVFLIHQPSVMRKDSNSTMSAINLPTGSSMAAAGSSRMRRHSNTANGKQFVLTLTPHVRRIKSAALEISCPPVSVSNLSPHPNSIEVIGGGQTIRNPQTNALPPPSKCLVRNPHLNLFPNKGNAGNTSNDQVYPIVEQIDEKCTHDKFVLDQDTDDDDDDSDDSPRHTPESESDIDRPRTQSTDSDTENNGSRSPLLSPLTTKKVILPEKKVNKEAQSDNVVVNPNNNNINNNNNNNGNNKSEDSGCPSSDCEQASASSKDMLLQVQDKAYGHNIWFDSVEAYNPGEGSSKMADTKRDVDQKETAKSLGAIPKTSISKHIRDLERELNNLESEESSSTAPTVRHLGVVVKTSSSQRPSSVSGSSSRRYSAGSFDCDRFKAEIYNQARGEWIALQSTLNPSHPLTRAIPPPILPIYNAHKSDSSGNSGGPSTSGPSNGPRRSFAVMDGNRLERHFQPKIRRSTRNRRQTNIIQINSSAAISRNDQESNSTDLDGIDIQEIPTNTLSIEELMEDHLSSIGKMSQDISLPSAAVMNMSRMEFGDTLLCDYWRHYSLPPEKQVQPKRLYKFPINFFGRREFKIAMDRLQLLALFDRDLGWMQAIVAILLGSLVSVLGAMILYLHFYKDIFAFIFCLVIAGSQYSLLKSVQPDAASPIHGFNKTVAYSRPIYFCLCSSLLILAYHLSEKSAQSGTDLVMIYGINVIPSEFFGVVQYLLTIVLLVLPVLFSLGFFPQINTFMMYILEQLDMHVFGGNASCSLPSSIVNVIRSVIGCLVLYGPAFGGLSEKRASQHILFSIFCALLISVGYHLSRSSSDFSCIWSLIKSSLVIHTDDDEEDPEDGTSKDDEKSSNVKDEKEPSLNETGDSTQDDLNDPLPKKLQSTVNARLKNDLFICCILAIFILGLHCSTVFTVLQPDLNPVLHTAAAVLGFLLHYVIPQMRKHLPWLCFSTPFLKQNEHGHFEPKDATKIMWFESTYVYLCFLERNVLYPLVFLSSLTADSIQIIDKFGLHLGTAIVVVCGLKCIRCCYSDPASQYLIVVFTVLFFRFDFSSANETFLMNYFLVSIIFKKVCEFLLKMQFIVTYIAPWQITWGSAFHAFAQPCSVPHSAMLFCQAAVSACLSTPLYPFLGSAIFLTSYVRPTKFWERDYNTKRIDHSNTRLSSQLERDLGADDNNLNSIFYEHLTRSLQHSLCGDLLLGRWGSVSQGDCFVLASDYLNCLVHIIEFGNGLCTFQMRGLEFRGTYCQQREVEAISEGLEENDGCCCCSPGHLPRMLSANAMFSTRWLAWQVVAAQYVLEGYSISDNLATATLQVFEFRKVLINYYVKSIIYYTIKSPKLIEWLNSPIIQNSLASLNNKFVDLDPIFNHNLDEDFDFRASGITRFSFCAVYIDWIQFCVEKRTQMMDEAKKQEQASGATATTKQEDGSSKKRYSGKVKDESEENDVKNENIELGRESPLISLLLALGLLARRTLATASHRSLSGVEFFLHGLHALFKGDFRITSARDEWVFADMDLLHGVVAPAVKMSLKLHQDHFLCPDEYSNPADLYEAISNHSKNLVISHEADPLWRSAVLRGAPNLLALRHVMEDGSDEYRVIRLTKRFLSFRVIKLNRECVRGLWAGQQQELIYLRNRNPERGSIQNAKQALRNIINSSCDQPIGYPIYVSPLTTSYAETNSQLCSIIGGSASLEKLRNMAYATWTRIRKRCREGCSSGSASLEHECDIPGASSYCNAPTPNNTLSCTTGTLSYGSQSLSGAGNRGSLASMGKPSSTTLLAGFLNREREQERESVRERYTMKQHTIVNRENERRATLPASASPAGGSSRELSKEAISAAQLGLKEQLNIEFGLSLAQTQPSKAHVSSLSSGNLAHAMGSGASKKLSVCGERKAKSEERQNVRESDDFPSLPKIALNKKVIIVDASEIYDCLDMGRRIDVIWPNEKMRATGGRSSWKDWQPTAGMVGVIVHFWQPNHPDALFRSNVNRTLFLIQMGERFVPVGESGVREYNALGADERIKIVQLSKAEINEEELNIDMTELLEPLEMLSVECSERPVEMKHNVRVVEKENQSDRDDIEDNKIEDDDDSQCYKIGKTVDEDDEDTVVEEEEEDDDDDDDDDDDEDEDEDDEDDDEEIVEEEDDDDDDDEGKEEVGDVKYELSAEKSVQNCFYKLPK